MREIVSPLLARLGITPNHYWLLLDLFAVVSSRREMLGQLGHDSGALRVIAMIYGALFGLMAVFLVTAEVSLSHYLTTFLGLSAFMLVAVLLAETSNSLVNPSEGLVLAHQPLNGATYTAAKLTHLVTIVVYLGAGLNLAPACLGLFIPEADWLYPLLQIGSAIGIGMVIALLCCSFYGILLRFTPPARLKAVSQYADLAPMLLVFALQTLQLWRPKRFPTLPLPKDPNVLLYWKVAGLLLLLAIIIFGLRSLSVDYLVKVASIAYGGSSTASRKSRSVLGGIVSRWFGGPSGLAGFEYVRRMMLRDFQFRKTLLGLSSSVILSAAMMAKDFRKSPFDQQFSTAHLFPHIIGMILFLLFVALPYGSDFKCRWAFLIVPSTSYPQFIKGVWALLWLRVVLLPHALVFPFCMWAWEGLEGLVFVAFSISLSSFYLGLTLPMLESVPFGKQTDSMSRAQVGPLMMLGAAGTALAVAVQYFVLFRSLSLVAVAALVTAVAAIFLTKSSITKAGDAVKFSLGLDAIEAGSGYVEL